MFFSSLIVNAYAGTIRIEGTLLERAGVYYFPEDGIFQISNNSKICPSNQCKLIPHDPSRLPMFLAFDDNV